MIRIAATTIGMTIFTAMPFSEFSGMVTGAKMKHKRRTYEIKQLVWSSADEILPSEKKMLLPNLYSKYSHNEVRKCIGQWFRNSARQWLNIIAEPATLVKVINGNNCIHTATGNTNGSRNGNVDQ